MLLETRIWKPCLCSCLGLRHRATHLTITVSSCVNGFVHCTWYKYWPLIGRFVSRGPGPVLWLVVGREPASRWAFTSDKVAVCRHGNGWQWFRRMWQTFSVNMRWLFKWDNEITDISQDLVMGCESSAIIALSSFGRPFDYLWREIWSQFLNLVWAGPTAIGSG